MSCLGLLQAKAQKDCLPHKKGNQGEHVLFNYCQLKYFDAYFSYFVSITASMGQGHLNKIVLTSIFGTADILSGSAEIDYNFVRK